MSIRQAFQTKSEEALQVAIEIERLESVIAQLKDHLKRYVEEHGPVVTSKYRWHFQQSVSWSFDGGKLEEMCALMALEGVNPWNMLSLPSSSHKKLGWDDSVLSRFGRRKVTRRFVSRKIMN